MKTNKRHLLSAAVLSLTLLGTIGGATLARAENQQQNGGGEFSPVVEIAAGAELNQTGTFSPCTSGCGVSQHGTDTRTSPILRFGFKGVDLMQLISSTPSVNHVSFLPISMILDTGGTDGFGHVQGAAGTSTPIRRLMGVLVEGNYDPGNGILVLRGKLARIDYDRDKGIFDWRALDASVGIQTSVAMGEKSKFDIEVDVGSNVGGIKLNGMADLSKALDIAPAMSSAYTINPYAALKAGVYSESIKVELIANAEHRFDLTPSSSRPVYKGRSLNVDSNHLSATLEVEYTFNGKGMEQLGRRMSLFADGIVDVDSLTLSDTLFGSGDLYRSFMGLGGFRMQF